LKLSQALVRKSPYNLQLNGLPIHLNGANFLLKQKRGKKGWVSRSKSNQNAGNAAPSEKSEGFQEEPPSPLTKSTPMVLM
jgi:hypothetical protein